MTEKYEPPAAPPPNYRSQSQSVVPQQQQHQQNDPRSQQRVSWTVGGGPSNSNRELGSNNPYREDSLSVPPGTRPSTISLPPGGSGSRTFQRSPSQPPGQGPSSNQTSDTEMGDEEFLPPPGPPPGHIKSETESEYSPPPGPPPGLAGTRSPEPPPYDPWMGPDDNLRPPPSFQSVRPQNDRSPANNADYDEATRAHDWCLGNRLWPAVDHDPYVVQRIEGGDIRLTVPPNTTEVTQYFPSLGRSYIRTTSTIGDTVLLSDLPVFASMSQSPLATGQRKTIYFEVHVMGLGDRYNPSNIIESGIAIGFLAPPYPAWRLPGWHRGSLGVHSDDGRRYVDNSYGGKDFTASFKKGEVVGIGMTFLPPVHGDRVSMRSEVFFTRNGRIDGKWDLHEEIDDSADEGDIRGLEGDYDLLAAVGVFGSVELECVFRREEWLFKG